MKAQLFLDSPAKWEPPEFAAYRKQQIMDYALLGLTILFLFSIFYLLTRFKKTIFVFLCRIFTLRHLAFVGGAILLLLLLQSFRYQITPPNYYGVAYRLDRWTGTTTMLIMNKEIPMIRQ